MLREICLLLITVPLRTGRATLIYIGEEGVNSGDKKIQNLRHITLGHEMQQLVNVKRDMFTTHYSSFKNWWGYLILHRGGGCQFW